ncbi:MAG: efflux RND transporter periplasmic adaptor subunit [candidate division KSB1 bacterium]|nr:efflux RND transporter periplasmic adaptor subunit [candidate division KSB1 bacterium]
MRKIFLMIFTTLFILNCGKKQDSMSTAKPEAAVVAVRAAKVQEMLIAEQIKITGELAPTFQVEVFPRANGIVVSESVSLGNFVRKDQVLAEVQQDVPGMEFARVRIEATNSGVITSDQVEIGSRVSVQKPAYTISGLRPIYMNGKVSEANLRQIRIGETVSVELDAYPNERLVGKIAEIDPVLDRLSRMATVKISIDNPNLKLKPGMFARCYVKLGDHTGLVVPLDAIVRTGANRYVFRIDDGKAKQVRVQTGAMVNDLIEVQGDLKAGDQVVVLGQNLLEDGTEVRIEGE